MCPNHGPQAANHQVGGDPLALGSNCMAGHEYRAPELNCLVEGKAGIEMHPQGSLPHLHAKSPAETKSYLLSVGEGFCEVWQVPTTDRQQAKLVFDLFLEWYLNKGWKVSDFSSQSKPGYLIKYSDCDPRKVLPDFKIQILFNGQLVLELWRSQ